MAAATDRGGFVRYRRFQELPAWQAVIELGIKTFALSRTGCFQGYSGLRDQFERAAVSVSNNIAEGFERGTHEELLTFLYYSKGSLGEVRSMLHLIARLPDLPVCTRDPEDLIATSEDLARQLGAWLESLKDSEDKGPRYRNTQTRQAIQASQRRESCMKDLRRIVEEGRSDRRGTSDESP